jgi:hypothetical protein
MSDRSPAPSERPTSAESRRQAPPPDAVEFIRFCHRRRHVGWPELYDEMCAVAARREFNGWDHEQLAERGLTFALYEMPRLAAWVRAVIGPEAAAPEVDHRAIAQPAAGTA